MPQQRIHEVTAKRLARLKESINDERKKIGKKALTVPDIIEEITSYFETKRNTELHERNKK